MIPGQGYEAKMDIADTILYPANDSLGVLKGIGQLKLEPKHFVTKIRSDNNLALGIDNSAWSLEPVWGDEVAVFDQNNKLVGSAVYQGQNMAITVWGHDTNSDTKNGMVNQEKLTLKLYSSFDNKVETLEVTEWEEGNATYTPGGISIIGGIKRSAAQATTRLLDNFPNPCSQDTEILFYLADEEKTTIELVNNVGQIIEVYDLGTLQQGNNSYRLKTNNLTSGTYFYTLKAGEFSGSKKLLVVK